MAVFNVPVVIGVNEEEIAKQIENEVQDRCVNKINNEIKKIIYSKYYGDEPLRNMVTKEIEKTIEKHQDTIIEMAAEKLADKLSRYKAVREKAAAIAEDIL